MCVYFACRLEKQSSIPCEAYESGSKSYTSEEILQILLNPKIDPQKVTRSRPVNISQWATYVVDLDHLDHPDDIRKDDFGKWRYSGSHVVQYRAEKTPEDELEFERVLPGTEGSDVFQLRRVHCKHPSNSNFQRLLAFVTGRCMLTVYLQSGT